MVALPLTESLDGPVAGSTLQEAKPSDITVRIIARGPVSIEKPSLPET